MFWPRYCGPHFTPGTPSVRENIPAEFTTCYPRSEESPPGILMEFSNFTGNRTTTPQRHLMLFLSQNILLGLLMTSSAAQAEGPGCHLPTPEVSGLSKDGDILLGGIFPLHDDVEYQEPTFTTRPAPLTCQRFQLQNYQSLQAMVFAIEEISRSSDLLPNITLGFRIYDSCRILQRSLEGTLWTLAGQAEPLPNFSCQRTLPIMGIIGDASSSCSIAMARVLGLYRLPQISFVSTSPLLSDRKQFPSFFRTIPNDDFQSRGLARLLIHFGWTWVGLLVEDNDYGQQGGQILKQELERLGACVSFFETIILSKANRNAFHIIQVIKNSTATAIVIFATDAGLLPLVDEMVRYGVNGKVFIATEGWSISSTLAMDMYSDVLIGTIGLTIYNGPVPGFEAHLNSVHHSRSAENGFLPVFWEEAFGCKWRGPNNITSTWDNTTEWCTGDEKLENVHIDYNNIYDTRIPYNVYTAVQAIAWALHDLNSHRPEEEQFFNGTSVDIQEIKPWQITQYIKKVHFKNKVGEEVFFNQNGEVPAQYDIVNWQRSTEGGIRPVTVGGYDDRAPEGKNVIVNVTAVLWPSQTNQIPVSVCTQSCQPGFWKAVKEGEPACCFLCVPCPQGEISNETDSVACLKCPWDQWPNLKQDQCIMKVKEYLTYEDALGGGLAGLCLCASLLPLAILKLFVYYKTTPIVKANNCSLSYLLLLSLTTCFLCSLIFIGYPTPEKCLLRQAAFGITFALCVSCILAKTIMVVIAFNATKPGSHLRRWTGPHLSYTVIFVCTLLQVLLCVSWLFITPPFSQYNIYALPGKILVECNEGSSLAFWLMLGYLGLLATISFIVAFLARKLPDSFNEAKFITFSMLSFLSVWISFIPAYLSTKGKYMVAMEIFAILASSSALLFCIFFHKAYIILLRPEMNTKEYLLGRVVGQRKGTVVVSAL
ncbi:extracellular calcium-sensing receptor-like [Pleurodeles waltl]|uniref:extracellular calcium-sensing receptor-like n=1 Tax=Pleurodeles waltl TaxID=8319 RepID=UPI00370973FA